ncbi:flagellar protein FlgN [Alkalihalophilus sp. As8PL]|uniref:Flagellar protein FlgN n=1 Tax=Alkalihalophilus sp. As8PL TaxID=3237103 RepID=A0AB39BZL7_9BACI
MSAKMVIQALAELLKLHQELNKQATLKVEAVKANDVSTLGQIIKEEASLIRAAQQADAKRVKEARAFMIEKGEGEEDVTIASMLPLVSHDETVVLKKLQRALLKEVDQLKKQNEQNRELLEESLRFVNLSLDLMVPQAEDVHYTKPHQKPEQTELFSRSVFDSKA